MLFSIQCYVSNVTLNCRILYEELVFQSTHIICHLKEFVILYTSPRFKPVVVEDIQEIDEYNRSKKNLIISNVPELNSGNKAEQIAAHVASVK